MDADEVEEDAPQSTSRWLNGSDSIGFGVKDVFGEIFDGGWRANWATNPIETHSVRVSLVCIRWYNSYTQFSFFLLLSLLLHIARLAPRMNVLGRMDRNR